MSAAVPAPVSITTVQPRPTNFFTVSGEAATRFSPARRSFGIPIFMPTPPGASSAPKTKTAPIRRRLAGSDDEDRHQHQQDHHGNGAPDRHLHEGFPGALMLADIHGAHLVFFG